MKFVSLTINNLGVFQGEHTFDLRASGTNHTARVVLFAGHNGAGKSSVFQALMLALYGPLAVNDRTTRAAYSEYLLARFHRPGHGAAPAQKASVSLRFEYVRAGIPADLVVTRLWLRNGSTVSETLQVYENGVAPEVQPEEYAAWLEEFAPPGLSSVIFFDAEQLETFVTPEEHDQFLRDTLDRLLGLDVVKRLSADLQQYIVKTGGGRGKDQHTLRLLLLSEQSFLEQHETKVRTLEEQSKQLVTEQATLTQKLKLVERNIEKAGGTYAELLPQRRERLLEVNKELEILSGQFRDLAADLLPFTLAPRLLASLSATITREGQERREHLAAEVMTARVRGAQASLLSEAVWANVDLPSDTRTAVVDRILQALLPQKTEDAAIQQPIHHFSDTEERQIQQWTIQTQQVTAPQATVLGQQIKELRGERERLERDLERAPEEAALVPLHEQRTEIQQELALNETSQKEISEQLGVAKFKLVEQTRKHGRAVEEFRTAQAGHHRLELARRSQNVLKVYQAELVKRRLHLLQEHIVNEFNVLCRKERLLAQVKIDPVAFTTTMWDYDGHPLQLHDLSAGERQLYTLALLSAMRKVSGLQLPLLVDTPLGRLDESHRERLVQTYFPRVSDQVLLFTTDAEFEAVMGAQGAEHVARTYRLSFDQTAGHTHVDHVATPLQETVSHGA